MENSCGLVVLHCFFVRRGEGAAVASVWRHSLTQLIHCKLVNFGVWLTD